jgi:hypothetical protein
LGAHVWGGAGSGAPAPRLKGTGAHPREGPTQGSAWRARSAALRGPLQLRATPKVPQGPGGGSLPRLLLLPHPGAAPPPPQDGRPRTCQSVMVPPAPVTTGARAM